MRAEVRDGMHDFLQVGRLACEDLAKCPDAFGHKPVKFTPGLWIN